MSHRQKTLAVTPGVVQTSLKSAARSFAAAVTATLLLCSAFAFAQQTSFQKQPLSLTPNSVAPSAGVPIHQLPEAGPQVPKATLNGPYGVAVDTAGRVYVANIFGNNVTVYNKNLKLAGTISAGMSFPAAVGVAFGGNIYVANNGGNNITVYNSSFAPTNTIGDPSLANPYSMFIDGSNDIWVLDAAGTVHLYLDNGTPVGSATLGGTAIGRQGSNVTLWGISSGSGFVTYAGNMGESVRYGVTFDGVFGPTWQAGGIGQDALNQQYVSDPASNSIWVVDPTDSYATGIIGTASAPYGVAVDTINQRIYVAETTVNEVAVYSLKSPYKLIGTIK